MIKRVNKALILMLLALISSATVWSQNAKIAGSVKDIQGNPLFLAQVVLEGKSKGTTTNDQGKYEFKSLEAGTYTVIFKNIGFESATRSITVAENQSINLDVVLESEIKSVDEVVVIGYGSTRTKDLTGSATIINEKDFAQ
jgi:iron complex outermembrane receptor protein